MVVSNTYMYEKELYFRTIFSNLTRLLFKNNYEEK